MLRISVSDLAYHVRPFWSLVAVIALRRIYPLAALVTFIGFAGQAHAQTAPACEPEMARLTSVQGTVEIRLSEAVSWRPAELNDILCMGATIRVSTFSRAALAFTDDSTLRLDQDTTLTIREREDERRTWLEMLTGAIHFFSHRPRSLKVDTPFVNAAAEGTEFLIRINGAEAHILMYEGVVLASNEAGQLRLGPDDAALIRAGEKPIPEIVVRPRDAVAWAVHYPPVLSVLADRDAPGTFRHEVKNALEWLDDNNYRYALRSLDKIPENERDARNEALRAGILLNIGRVEEAEAAIERALAIDAEAADAYALRTILHVVRNDRAQASRDADRAVTLAPNSSTALIAQSYARQASFDLEGARDSLRTAVEKNPNDALAYARLSEIELSFGDHDRASDAAVEATRLAPTLARTQTVRGFSHLAEIDTGAARTAFARSIELNSTDPLPYLGQGLAKIRDGNLEAGRRDLEIAASLDPNNALIRSYLGKAYFEEKRGPKDATQFEIAKKLDPNDPTPWFYDAIRKQTENRPIEALRDLEKAIELNDNRAVYRSSLLLDNDRAAREVSLARIYDDLGFEQLAIRQASRSTSLDPTNHSAHRFLSDAYARRPEHEIARLSELLKSKLLQEINLSPVLPSQSATDLNIAKNIGPSEVSNNEFNQLFERDGLNFQASGFVGNNKSWGEEIAVNIIANDLSVSAGQLKSRTNGFRENFDVDNDIYNVFAQIFASKNLNFQAEHVGRNSKTGDIKLRFDPNIFSNRDNVSLERNTFRIGATYRHNNENTLLISYINNNDDTKSQLFIEDEFFGDIVTDDRNTENGSQFEVQHIIKDQYNSSLLGFGYANVDGNGVSITRDDIFGETILPIELSSENVTLYSYQYINFVEGISIDFGLSYDNLADDFSDAERISPKIGIQWTPLEGVHFRAAAFRNVKRQFVVDTTLEPTQIAGFNQFYDDRNLTRTNFYGAGIDFDLPQNAKGGLEFFQRDSKVPFSVDSTDQKIDTLRLYYFKTLGKRISLSVETEFENTHFDTLATNIPRRIRSFILPVNIRYFGNSGLFCGLVANYVHQDIEQLEAGGTLSKKDDDFFVLDANVGWRDPKGRLLFEFEAGNILDQKFRYQDTNFRTTRDRSARFIPDATYLARVTLNF